MLWDTGTWEPQGDVDEGLAKGKLAFVLHGKRLKGKWALVRLRSRKSDRGKRNWLLIKERDEYAGPEKRPIIEREKKSAKSGRSMEEIAAKVRRTWSSSKKKTARR
jgi:bifunctional non-homologous end joining protein LigD